MPNEKGINFKSIHYVNLLRLHSMFVAPQEHNVIFNLYQNVLICKHQQIISSLMLKNLCMNEFNAERDAVLKFSLGYNNKCLIIS